MKILITLLMLSSIAHAKTEYIYTSQAPGKSITKLQAMRQLITSDNKATVFKCTPVMVNDKGNVVNKK